VKAACDALEALGVERKAAKQSLPQ
jgi:hypothetical protein